MRRLAGSVLGVALILGLAWAPSGWTFHVPAGADLQGVLARVPTGTTVVLSEGRYEGPVRIDRSVTLVGNGAVIDGQGHDVALAVFASGAEVRSVEVAGGDTGILVRDAGDVTVADVKVIGAAVHGIELVDAHARVEAAHVEGLSSPFAQGIEIRNSDGRPDSTIERSTVIGGQEGIVSHVSEVAVLDNVVRDTTMRAITITEMSDGWVRDNRVTGAVGSGLYCGDMSRCEFTNNSVATVDEGVGGRSSAGWGLVVHYHASASTHGDSLNGVAGPTATFVGSRITERSPLEPGSGARAVWPALGASAAAIGALAVAYLVARRSMRRTSASGPSLSRPAAQTLMTVLLVGIVVQSFHMSEHFLQLWRVKVDGVPSRGGLVGPVVDAELVHFAYNALVLGSLAVLFAGRRRGWLGGRGVMTGDGMLVAALAIQSYHVIEHTFKVAQFVRTGSKVNPGIAGGSIDLVLLHFAINLAVYLGVLIATVVYVRAWRGSADEMTADGRAPVTT